MKKRVLIVSSGKLDLSGVPSVIMTIVRALHEEYTFDLMLSEREDGELEKEFLSYGGRIFQYRKMHFAARPLQTAADFLRPLSLYRITKKILRDNGPYDAVHCHNEFDMAGSLAAAAKLGVPIRIAHEHKLWGSCGAASRAFRALCRRTINRRATVRVGCSAQANEAFYGQGAFVQVLYNPYDSKRYSPRGGAVPEGQIRAVQVGYFCEKKNQLFSLEVFSRLAAACPDARMVWIGRDEGGYGKALRERITALGLDNRVDLLPPDADIPAVLDQSNLFLLPSLTEGFGIVLIEAQAMGLSCYASDAVPRETDVGGVTYLPLSNGPDAWAQTILQEAHYKEKTPRDCAMFSVNTFIRRVRGLYEGM